MPPNSVETASNSASVGIGAVALICSIAPRIWKKAPVKTREKEWGSDDSCAAGAELGNVAGSLYVNELAAFRVILAKPEAIRLACSGFERGRAGMEWRAGL